MNPVVLDHPMVGQGMGDNPLNTVFVSSPRTVETSLIELVGITNFDTFIEGFSGLKLHNKLMHRFFEAVLNEVQY